MELSELLFNAIDQYFFEAVIAFMILMTLYGHRRGFVRMSVSLASAVISFLIVKWSLPAFMTAVRGSAWFEEYGRKLTEKLYPEAEAELSGGLFELLNIDQAAEAAGEYLSALILNAVCFLLLFLLVNIALKLVVHFLDFLTKLPVLCGMNQICGAMVGFAESIFYLWIVMIAVAFTPGAELSQSILPQIFQNELLLFIYQNNFLLKLLAGIFGA